MTKPLSCEQAVEQFFAYLDRALAGEPLNSRRLDTFVKNRLPQSPVPDGLEARIRRTLGQTSTE